MHRERSVGSCAATADSAAQALLALNAASSARMTVSRRPALPKNESGVRNEGPALTDKSEASRPSPHELGAQAQPDITIASSTSTSSSSTRADSGADARSSDVQHLQEASSSNARKTTRDRQRILRGSTFSASTSASASDTDNASATAHQLVSTLGIGISSNIDFCDRGDGSHRMLAAAATHFVNLDAAEAASVDRPHACSKCSFQFTRSSHLVDHMRAKHDGAKPFSCDQCDYRCTRSSQLTRHTRQRHSEERPHVCNECAYRCLTSGDLTRHKVMVHSDERRFSCDLCEYKCHTNSRLQQHKLVHTKP